MASITSARFRTRVARAAFVALAASCCWSQPRLAEAQLGGRVVPPASYFSTLEGSYERGDYRAAMNGFQDEWQGGIKNGTTRWVDSICFHAMLGECYYQQGDHIHALEQYNAACNLWNFHSTWMLNVQWPAEPRAANQANLAPWGQSQRKPQYASYPDTYSVKQGNIDNSAVVQRGGVVQLAVLYPVNVVEICRCTALAARRRRELLGPLAPFDKLSTELVTALSGGATTPGSWSQCFVDVMQGCALAASGKDQAAKGVLERGLVAAGRYDHPLTGLALFELGRIELSAGNFAAAAGRFEEATYAAYQANDASLIDEAFRYYALAQLMNGKPGNFAAPFPIAMIWAKANKKETLYASLATLSAEAFALAGDARSAAGAVSAAQSAMGRNSLLTPSKTGARLNYIAAQLAYQQGDVAAGDAALARTMAFQSTGSVWVFQIVLADEWFKTGVISRREAFDVYRTVLREPTPADWLSSPMESISVLLTPHGGALENWFLVALDRKEEEAAIDISDMIRRHRFFNSQSIGGRLLSLRWVLDGPEEVLSKETKLQRTEILAAFPQFDAARKEAEAVRAKIQEKSLLPENPEDQAAQAKLFEQYTALAAKQETILREIALRRTPCEMVFPPRRKVEDVQRALGEKTAAIAYIRASDKLFASVITAKDVSLVEIPRAIGPRGVFGQVEQLLRELGNVGPQRPITVETLSHVKWKTIAQALTESLLTNARQGATNFPNDFEELVVVPEGNLWYLPFELLGSKEGANDQPLITRLRVRYAPTVGLIAPDGRRRPPLPATLLAIGKVHPQDKTGLTEAAAEDFMNGVSMTLPVNVKTALPANPAVFTSFLERLVVFDDVAPGSNGAFSWAPLPWAHGKTGGDLAAQLNLPWTGPSQVVLPAFHSAAETAASNANGNDLFLSACGLMAAGAETVVLTRWRTGGQTSFDIVREFVREVDHTTPADAWQRAVLLAMSNPVDLSKEPRVQGNAGDPPPASHPFFWAGGMLFDSGDPLPGVAPVDEGVAAKLKEKQRLLEEALERQRKAQQQQTNDEPKDGAAAAPAGDGAPKADPPKRDRPTRERRGANAGDAEKAPREKPERAGGR